MRFPNEARLAALPTITTSTSSNNFITVRFFQSALAQLTSWQRKLRYNELNSGISGGSETSEKGALTGALTREIGRFELADGSPILLDEIGELPLFGL
jgi:sigma54-dependent transcription regulator